MAACHGEHDDVLNESLRSQNQHGDLVLLGVRCFAPLFLSSLRVCVFLLLARFLDLSLISCSVSFSLFLYVSFVDVTVQVSCCHASSLSLFVALLRPPSPSNTRSHHVGYE